MSVYVCMCWTVGALIRTDKGGGGIPGGAFLRMDKGWVPGWVLIHHTRNHNRLGLSSEPKQSYKAVL